jgi:peptide/nickel transport system permease protein
VRDIEVLESPQPESRQVEIAPDLLTKRKGQLRLITERFMRNRIALAGLVVLVLLGVAVIIAPVLTGATPTYDPATYIQIKLQFAPPQPGHWLGFDDLGRDELARMLYGGRISLTVGLLTMVVSMVFGVTLGALAGFYGGWVDVVVMRFTDAVLSVPLYLILFVLSDILLVLNKGNGSVTYVVALISIFEWTTVARVVRGEFLSVKEREFLLAARTLGARDWRLIFLHILPNALGPIMVAATLAIGDAIILESILSFFGFGVQPPTPTWGAMLSDSQEYVTSAPLLLYLPGLAILITVLSFNLVGDGLRDALDPHMTQR